MGKEPTCCRKAYQDEKYNLGLDIPNLPYLIDKDFNLTQTTVIIYYLCRQYAPQLLGNSPQKNAKIDEIFQFLRELKNTFTTLSYEKGDREEII